MTTSTPALPRESAAEPATEPATEPAMLLSLPVEVLDIVTASLRPGDLARLAATCRALADNDVLARRRRRDAETLARTARVAADVSSRLGALGDDDAEKLDAADVVAEADVAHPGPNEWRLVESAATYEWTGEQGAVRVICGANWPWVENDTIRAICGPSWPWRERGSVTAICGPGAAGMHIVDGRDSMFMRVDCDDDGRALSLRQYERRGPLHNLMTAWDVERIALKANEILALECGGREEREAADGARCREEKDDGNAESEVARRGLVQALLAHELVDDHERACRDVENEDD